MKIMHIFGSNGPNWIQLCEREQTNKLNINKTWLQFVAMVVIATD